MIPNHEMYNVRHLRIFSMKFQDFGPFQYIKISNNMRNTLSKQCWKTAQSWVLDSENDWKSFYFGKYPSIQDTVMFIAVLFAAINIFSHRKKEGQKMWKSVFASFIYFPNTEKTVQWTKRIIKHYYLTWLHIKDFTPT